MLDIIKSIEEFLIKYNLSLVDILFLIVSYPVMELVKSKIKKERWFFVSIIINVVLAIVSSAYCFFAYGTSLIISGITLVIRFLAYWSLAGRVHDIVNKRILKKDSESGKT